MQEWEVKNKQPSKTKKAYIYGTKEDTAVFNIYFKSSWADKKPGS